MMKKSNLFQAETGRLAIDWKQGLGG